jgi:general L-amino acid transport system permease protein
MWVRRNLFSSFGNALITLACAALLVMILRALLDWAIFDAAWRGTRLADCPDPDAACWPFLRARFDQFVYGVYPLAERWRIDLALVAGLVAAVLLFLPSVHRRPLSVVALLLIWPILAGVLLGGGVAGLVAVETAKWGGLMLTLFMAVTTISISIPLGVLLALARRSRQPVVRTLALCWIEFWRGVPMLAVLFVAVSMFPLFMPAQVELDRLTRAMSAFVLVTAAFFAEAVRGGLQAVPAGQEEASTALGLSYWRRMTLIILPQAWPVALPSIVNISIILFKETTLVIVIGLFCLLGMVQIAATSPEWISEQAIMTGYAFAAAVYWAFCFGLSRLGLGIERRMARRQGRIGTQNGDDR